MKTMLALGLTNDAIRAAVIGNPYTKQPLLKQCKTVSLPAGVVVDGEVVDHDVVTSLLKSMISREKFPRRHVALVYASRRMIFREATFPEMGLAELRETLRFQAKNLIPLPMDESLLDFVPLTRENENDGPMLHGIIVATLRSGLENTANAIEDAGMTVTSIDASAFCMARVFLGESIQGTNVLVNVSSNSTNVIILNDTRLAFLRTIPSGIDEVTSSLASSLDIPVEDAKEIQQKIGLWGVPTNPSLQKASEVVRNTAAQLVISIRNTIGFFTVDHPESTITDIVLVGEGSTLSGFPKMLADMTGTAVRVGDPFSKFTYKNEESRKEITAHSNAYASVLGLALGRRP